MTSKKLSIENLTFEATKVNVLHKNTAARKKSALRNASNLVQVG